MRDVLIRVALICLLTTAALADGVNGGGSAVPTGAAGGGLTGTYPNPSLANPSASTLGGVQSIAAVAHNFLTSISTSGVPAQAQPAVGDVSGFGAGVATALGLATNASGGVPTVPVANSQIATGQAVANLGYTPVNKAGDTMSGNLAIGASSAQLTINATSGNAVAQLQLAGVVQSGIVADSTQVAQWFDNVNSAQFLAVATSSGNLLLGESGKTVAFTSVTTGTNADFACLSSGLVLLLQSSACTISSKRFKIVDGVMPDENALADVLALTPSMFHMRPRYPKDVLDRHDVLPERDPNRRAEQVGLYAEDVAAVEPLAAIYEDDMKTPKSYRQEAILAMLVGAVRAQQAEIAQLQRQLLASQHAQK